MMRVLSFFALKPKATLLRPARYGGQARAYRRLPASAGRRVRSFLICAALIAAAVWLRCGPLPPDLLKLDTLDSTVVVDRNGVELYEALGSDGTRAQQMRAGSIPAIVAAATVAAEDRRFWSHHGIDAMAVLRAIKQNVAEGSIVEGGSTITQQAAKLLLLRRAADRRRGWRTKLQEAVIALRLEHRLTKREILALYLNLAGYGNQTTGIERASRVYFGVGAGMLTPAQAAFLAGLPQRPSTFNPYRSQELAVSRQRVVLARMAAAGTISRAELDEARSERLAFSRADRRFLAPHFVEMVLAGLGPSRPGRVETTLDAGLQADVAGILQTHRATLDRHGATNVAVVVLDNARHEWLAWEGSGDYFDTAHGGAINGPSIPRQPGSALKPFTYALAFEKGFTPASVLPDVPLSFPTAQPGVVYSPRNYDGRYRGPLLARTALAGSENVPAVSLAADVGVPDLLRFLRRAGFTTFDRTAAYYGLGLTLGNAEVRLDELVAAYSAFASGGEWQRPHVRAARDGWSQSAERQILFSPRTAFWIADILADDAARAYIFGRGSSLELPFPVAVKTGTSQAYHDNWTIGFTKRVTVGVWVGNFDRRPLRNSSGVTGAAPIFQAVMLAAHKRIGESDETLHSDGPGVEPREICSLSGEAANSWCPVRRREWLPPGDESVPCSWHHLSEQGLLTIWPPEFREWAGRRAPAGSPRAVPTAGQVREPPVRRVRAASDTPVFRMANPPTGATYLIDPTLRPEFQTLPLRVVSASPTRIEWSINGNAVGVTSSESPLEWKLEPGQHHIVARDIRGNVAESVVTVR
jgi:penicillin-binding protein 1C